MYQINTKGKQNDKEDEEKERTRLKMTAVAQQELVACLQCLLNCPSAVRSKFCMAGDLKNMMYLLILDKYRSRINKVECKDIMLSECNKR